MKNNIYTYQDYRSYLVDWLKTQSSSRGLISKMAAAARCQRSYLSKALGGSAQLTLSQAYEIARFCDLNDDQTDYFLGLVEIERSSSASHKKFLEKRLSNLKLSNSDLKNRVGKRKILEPANENLNIAYYSAWYFSAIRILTSIPEFTTVKSIARKLNLPEATVEEALHQLSLQDCVSFEAGRWRFNASERHLPKASRLIAFHHANWRQKAIENSKYTDHNGTHFTVVQSLSREDAQKLKLMLL
ncbi:MAG: TIGR02147 family protein, partial [Proteobacteria bacterium]|nr:TIGR02147 family protein [Pseudomonadota bacterium]